MRTGDRRLVASGPSAMLDEALAMAKAFILESQSNGRGGGGDDDDDDQGDDGLGPSRHVLVGLVGRRR